MNFPEVSRTANEFKNQLRQQTAEGGGFRRAIAIRSIFPSSIRFGEGPI